MTKRQKKSSKEEVLYTAERILAHRLKQNGVGIEFLVKWLGYDEEKDNTWEPKANLLDPSILESYLKENPEAADDINNNRKRFKKLRKSDTTVTTQASQMNGVLINQTAPPNIVLPRAPIASTGQTSATVSAQISVNKSSNADGQSRLKKKKKKSRNHDSSKESKAKKVSHKHRIHSSPKLDACKAKNASAQPTRSLEMLESH